MASSHSLGTDHVCEYADLIRPELPDNSEGLYFLCGGQISFFFSNDYAWSYYWLYDVGKLIKNLLSVHLLFRRVRGRVRDPLSVINTFKSPGFV